MIMIILSGPFCLICVSLSLCVVSMQDASMQHERSNEISNPSEKVIEEQVVKLTSLWDDVEAEQALIPVGSFPKDRNPSGSDLFLGGGGGRGNRNSKNQHVAREPKRQAAPAKPSVEAVKQRTKTLKDFKSTCANLQKALNTGENVLNVLAMKVHGSQELDFVVVPVANNYINNFNDSCVMFRLCWFTIHNCFLCICAVL